MQNEGTFNYCRRRGLKVPISIFRSFTHATRSYHMYKMATGKEIRWFQTNLASCSQRHSFNSHWLILCETIKSFELRIGGELELFKIASSMLKPQCSSEIKLMEWKGRTSGVLPGLSRQGGAQVPIRGARLLIRLRLGCLTRVFENHLWLDKSLIFWFWVFIKDF